MEKEGEKREKEKEGEKREKEEEEEGRNHLFGCGNVRYGLEQGNGLFVSFFPDDGG